MDAEEVREIGREQASLGEGVRVCATSSSRFREKAPCRLVRQDSTAEPIQWCSQVLFRSFQVLSNTQACGSEFAAGT